MCPIRPCEPGVVVHGSHPARATFRVISIGNVVAVRDGVRYFHEAVAENPADYYAARGEAAGVWRGAGAEQLGLTGRVLREDLTRILEGRHPATGEKLGRHHGKRKNVAYDVTFGTAAFLRARIGSLGRALRTLRQASVVPETTRTHPSPQAV
jgi:hypothetical protein